MFTLKIKDLQAHTTLGIYDWEKQAPRLVILNIELQVNTPTAAHTDNIADAVDYATLESVIITHLENNRYELIERLVADVASLILSQDPRITKVILEADKPGALNHSRSVSISATFSQH